jgi:hypothetical protein
VSNFVLIANQSWGTLQTRKADGTYKALAGQTVTLSGTVYPNSDGTGTPITPLVTNADGEIPGYIAGGTYTLTVGADVSLVDAVSGLTENAIATLQASPVNVLNYGADKAGTTDAASAFAAALAVNGHATVPPGTYRLDTVVTLTASQSLELQPGAILKRIAAAASTDPVVRLAGNFAGLVGEGQVVSEKASPRGVVNIGPTSLTASEVNINWARVDENIDIVGVKANGNIGLCFDSTEPGGGVGFGAGSNYNGSIGALIIRSVGTAVKMGPLCNGHSVGGIRAYDIGQYIYHLAGGAAGISESHFAGGFTHFSPGVTVLKLERAAYPTFHGVNAEPGAGSKYYDIDANCTGVQIIGHDNCPTAPTDLGAGSEILVNGLLKVAGKSLTSPPAARVKMTAVQSVPDLTQTVINWNAEDYDNASMHDNVTNNGRLTAPVAGVYAIKCHLAFAASATGFRDMRFRLNGTTEFAWTAVGPPSGGNAVLALATDYSLAAGDYVEVRAYHNIGAANNVGGAGALAAFSMHRVGNPT